MARTKLQARLGLPRSDPICQAIKKCGDRCTNRKKYGNFCGVHQAKEECPVCYENKRCEKLICGHGLCRSCSGQWFSGNTTCPMCRAVVKVEPVRRYNPQSAAITELEEIEAFAQVYFAMRVAFDTNPQTPRHRVQAFQPRNLVDYFDLVM